MGSLLNNSKPIKRRNKCEPALSKSTLECRATQWRGELTDEGAAIEAQLAKLHHCKSVLEAKHSIMVVLTTT
jgi:hypothetical protein